MPVLPIIEIGHPTLRSRAREVRDDELGTPELHRICDDLVETMHAANGAGLAAPQVDVPLRIFAVEVGDNPRYPYKPRLARRVLVNPVVRPAHRRDLPELRGLPQHPEPARPPPPPHRGRGHLPRPATAASTSSASAASAPARCSTSSTTSTASSSPTGSRTRRRSAPGRCSAAYRQDAWVESIRPLLERFPGEAAPR